MAPAHDVLEDWSILRWLDRLYLEVGQNLAEFQKNIGGHPALRRAYRKWMGELLERQPTVGQAIFREAIKSQELETSFVDDTLVALLQSAAAKSLIENNEDDLIANARKNLRRVIHLVRLACLTTPEWARGHVGAFRLPKGAAWAALIGIVKRHWSESEAEPERALLVLGLVEDWAKGVSLKRTLSGRCRGCGCHCPRASRCIRWLLAQRRAQAGNPNSCKNPKGRHSSIPGNTSDPKTDRIRPVKGS